MSPPRWTRTPNRSSLRGVIIPYCFYSSHSVVEYYCSVVDSLSYVYIGVFYFVFAIVWRPRLNSLLPVPIASHHEHLSVIVTHLNYFVSLRCCFIAPFRAQLLAL